MLKIRELPLEEWNRVAHLGHFDTCGLPSPYHARILVVETEDNQIVGIWSAMNVVHLEGCWIEPSHRCKGVVAGKLLRGMRRFLRKEGVKSVFTLSIDPYVTKLAKKIGFKQLPGESLALIDGEL